MPIALAEILPAVKGLAGCDTAQGICKDIEHGAERLLDSADTPRYPVAVEPAAARLQSRR